jgi:hypothetical protein
MIIYAIKNKLSADLSHCFQLPLLTSVAKLMSRFFCRRRQNSANSKSTYGKAKKGINNFRAQVAKWVKTNKK